MQSGDFVSRHYCHRCDGRVWPYDTFENSTIAPEIGASGNPVLLSSFNSRAHQKGMAQLAWCRNCKGWVETTRKSRIDLLLEYAEREGVQFRFNERIIDAPLGSPRRAANLANAIELRRESRSAGSGVINLRPRLRKTRSA